MLSGHFGFRSVFVSASHGNALPPNLGSGNVLPDGNASIVMSLD